ncbi:hypothetical protein J6590_043967, partial [Homalodisca vitripennis]
MGQFAFSTTKKNNFAQSLDIPDARPGADSTTAILPPLSHFSLTFLFLTHSLL